MHACLCVYMCTHDGTQKRNGNKIWDNSYLSERHRVRRIGKETNRYRSVTGTF